MKRTSQIFIGAFLLMNAANVLGEVSYHTVRVGDLDIFYREAGPKDAPTILLLHGLPSSSRMFQPLLESELATQYHLVAPDYPGFGHSSWPDPKNFAYTFDHLAKVIQDFTEQSLEATRKRHVGTSPDPTLYNPDLWVDEFYFLNQPGQADIQADLFYDYQNNLKSYPKWQKWLRETQPPLLVLWGRYDPSFTVAGAEAYQRDNPSAEVHILDAGHFALDLKSEDIIPLTQDFMARQAQP